MSVPPHRPPKSGKRILRRVYVKSSRAGYSQERAAKIAWGAVRRADREKEELQ
jgi:hypothetical protein